ncbi:MAG TPA: Holliday junction branch migration protein RuvA [Bacilli bacterium]|nr:Holliday junction branch migration protein RuvA [Bacilli bacterium]
MIYGLKGRIVQIDSESIVVDVHDIFYRILVCHPDYFHVDESRLIYTEQIIREDEQYLVGFVDDDERRAFLDLISVSGIGPKTALNALRATSPALLYQAIASKDTKYLKKLPGIGPKAASQIILDIKGQLSETDATDRSLSPNVIEALLSLGFKNSDINRAIKNAYLPGISDDELLKRCLQIIRK